MLHNLVEANFDLFRYLLLGDQLKPWELHPLVSTGIHWYMQLETVYGEIYRVLKPGAMFASYEWVGTSLFNPENPEHVRVMDEINYGNGLPVRIPSQS